MDNARMALDDEKPLEWIGSSHKDLMALPLKVRRLFGFAKRTWTSFAAGSG
jgi:phage-related protein